MVLSEQGQIVQPPDRLINFHRRLNKVLLDNIAINKEKDRLAAENAQLEDLIQQFLNGTKLNDKTLLEDNPLFVVNGRYCHHCVCPRLSLLFASYSTLSSSHFHLC